LKKTKQKRWKGKKKNNERDGRRETGKRREKRDGKHPLNLLSKKKIPSYATAKKFMLLNTKASASGGLCPQNSIRGLPSLVPLLHAL